MPKYVDAEALAERFRDMAEFADGIQAVALRAAADAAEDMPEADVRQVLSGEWQVVRGYFRFLRCPFCGYETENEKQPKKDGWKFCPGCGNKCSGGGYRREEQGGTGGRQLPLYSEAGESGKERGTLCGSDGIPGDTEH